MSEAEIIATTEAPSDQIAAAELEQAMMALINDPNLSDHAKQLFMARLAVRKEDLKAEVADEIRQEIEDEYELAADEGQELGLDDLETERQLMMGVGDHARPIVIRWLVARDFERMSAYVPALVRLIYKRGPSKLEGLSAMELLSELFKIIQGEGKGKIKNAFYRELSLCLSSDTQVVTAEFLRDKCLPGEVVRAAIAVYETNARFFTELQALVPGDILGPLTTSFGTLMASIKNLGQMSLELAQGLSGIGTTLSGGEAPSSILSLLSMAGRQTSSNPWTSAPSGDISNPFAADTTEKAMSAGSTARTSSPTTTATETETLAPAEGGSPA